MAEFSDSGPMAGLDGWLNLTWPPAIYSQRFYCVLDDSSLSLFQSDQESQLFRCIPLTTITAVDSVPADSLPSFAVQIEGGASLVFACSSIVQCECWVCALRQPPLGERVSRSDFEFRRLIGSGSSGKVRVARRNGTDEIYAIKSIRKNPHSKTACVGRIVAERNILMRAAHPFITRFFWAFQSLTKFYFVIEYVRGGDLRHYLNRQQEFSPAQIRLYLAEIVVALKRLHKLGIIYRDLKPENILLDDRGHIKLADFGLSRELGRDPQREYSLCGTFEFIAPEMIKQEQQTFALDWWALGVLAYLLMVGSFPFQCDNAKRLFEWILNRQPQFRRGLDPAAASLLRGLLEKDPARRLGGIGSEITRHEYFAGLSWERVEAQGYEPEFRPPMSKDDSCSNFDAEFTTQPGADSFDFKQGGEIPSSYGGDLMFPGFSYESDSVILE
jgi:serine/threonine protein kinase